MRIRTQMFIAVFSFLMITLVIVYSMYMQTTDIVIKNNNKYSEDLIDRSKLEMRQSYEEMNQIMVSLGFDPFIQQFMAQTDPALSYPMIKDLDRKIISLKAGRKGIEDIVLIGTGGAKYSLNGGIGQIGKYEQEIVESNDVYVSGLEKFRYDSSEIDCLFFAQNVYSNNLNDGSVGSKIGYIAVVINVNSVFFESDNANKQTGVHFYLIDRYGNIFPEGESDHIAQIVHDLSDKRETQKQYRIEGVKGSAKLQVIDQLKAYSLGFIPEEALLSELSSVRIRSMTIIFIALLLMVLPFVLIIHNIVQPIHKLVRFIKLIKKGNLNNLQSKLQLKGNIEMKVVAEELNAMLAEINDLTRKLVETTTNLLEAEIEKEKAASAFLRSQINPHFLNNTLESIRGIALEEGIRKIAEMIKALGKLFHYSIKGADYVSLEQEVNAVKSYVFLQQMRFEERFEVVYAFTEEALKVSVMKMILQPLVENSILHGLEPKTSKGLLTIGGNITEDRQLMIMIKDDGLGIDSDKLTEIRSKLHARSAKEGDGGGKYYSNTDNIGILNVHNRLRLTYGPMYGLTIESEPDRGTQITLLMPAN